MRALSARRFSPRALRRFGAGQLAFRLREYSLHWKAIDGIALDGNLASWPACDDFGRWCGTVKLALTSNVLLFGATYGLTDRIEIGGYSEMMRTSAKGTAGQILPSSLYRFTPVAARGDSTGLGDTSVTGKFRIWRSGHHVLAVAGELRFPTGDSDNLLMSGRLQKKAAVIWSAETRRVTPHANGGYLWVGPGFNRPPHTSSRVYSPSDEFQYGGGVDARVHRVSRLVETCLGDISRTRADSSSSKTAIE